MNAPQQQLRQAILVAAATSYCRGFISGLAESNNVSSTKLAEGVAASLPPEGPGLINHLPSRILRGKAPNHRSSVEPVALDDGPHSKKPPVKRVMSASARKRISEAQKLRWSKFKNRSKEVKRRMTVAAKNKSK